MSSFWTKYKTNYNAHNRRFLRGGNKSFDSEVVLSSSIPLIKKSDGEITSDSRLILFIRTISSLPL